MVVLDEIVSELHSVMTVNVYNFKAMIVKAFWL